MAHNFPTSSGGSHPSNASIYSSSTPIIESVRDGDTAANSEAGIRSSLSSPAFVQSSHSSGAEANSTKISQPLSKPKTQNTSNTAAANTARNPIRNIPENLDHFGYLKYLPSTVWTFLFSHAPALQAILRSLNELDQQIVMRLCYLQQAVSERAMRLWVQPDSLSDLRKSITALLNCHILQTNDSKRSEFTQYILDATLKTQLRNTILHGPAVSDLSYVVPARDEVAFAPSANAPSKHMLITYSKERWNNLLRYIVSPGEGKAPSPGDSPLASEPLFMSPMDDIPPEQPCKEVVTILMRRRLLPTSNTKASQQGRMSREAFSWLLKDLRSQIVSLIVEYLFMVDAGNLSTPAYQSETRIKAAQSAQKKYEMIIPLNSIEGNSLDEYRNESIPLKTRIEKSTKAVQELLLLILSLSQATLGQPFLNTSLTAIQKDFLNVATDLGLLWRFNKDSSIYYVAPYSLLLKQDDEDSQNLTATISTLSANATHTRVESSNPGIAGHHTSLSEDYFYPHLVEHAGDEVEFGNRNQETVRDNAECPTSKWSGREGEKERHAVKDPSAPSSAPMLPFNQMNPVSSLEAGIVVQSNFKVYIYTASALHISVLSHLCELQARTINLVVGLLTRESVLAAYRSGITSDQIIRFLESHAHPALYEHAAKENRMLLPENIMIQLRMWEAEQHRLTLERAVLFKKWQVEFLPELFQRSVRWALGKGYCLHYTQWSEEMDSEEFEEWMRREKYLCVPLDAKAEMIEKIREFREAIAKQREAEMNKED